jgi:histidinol-phosphatase (PHP family)
LPDKRDFYYLTDTSADESAQLEREYIAAHTDMLREFGDFDVVGHIGYPHRYGNFFNGAMTKYRAEFAELFTALAHSGKGIELNTSGLYSSDHGGALPTPELLKLFRECGGEIVTLGSDAHRAADVGKGLAEGAALLREAGFTRYAVFERREARFVKL